MNIRIGLHKCLHSAALFILLILSFSACTKKENPEGSVLETPGEVRIVGQMDLQYAKEFSVDYLEDGSAVIQIGDQSIHWEMDAAHSPQHIYLASSSAMDYFRQLGALEQVSMTGTPYTDWYIPEIRELVYQDEISFAGKYNAPDLEYILSENCDLAIENTMIYHTPEILEQIESLGIPVVVERSSYENDPLGRLEWIKLYGLLSGHLEEAEHYFAEACRKIEKLEESIAKEQQTSGKVTAAYFYLNASGMVNVRMPEDYMVKNLELAGGMYCFSDVLQDAESSHKASVSMDMESFYALAKDADILIYNGVIGDDVQCLEDLLKKNDLFRDFKAVRSGRVWTADRRVFQESTEMAEIIRELHFVCYGGEETLRYFSLLGA